ncbi:hypothetical protein Pcinc_019750 [Petrolisthes cinctipes]|uniref:Uncharacterized protein n=1 Tax=Petrolisthes cinctipes TaxID=88211 RepID=A0AAE1FJH9_PETCI|nr:hypothetical protein Pcinc_019750 [Petrolisthes cinctipes]
MMGSVWLRDVLLVLVLVGSAWGYSITTRIGNEEVQLPDVIIVRQRPPGTSDLRERCGDLTSDLGGSGCYGTGEGRPRYSFSGWVLRRGYIGRFQGPTLADYDG